MALLSRLTLPAFTTERLTLRSATAQDLELLWAIWRDPDVRRYLFDNKPVERETATEVLESALRAVPRGLGLWVVERRGRPIPIGCVGLLPVTVAAHYDSSLKGLVEPVAAFAPAFWGHGYANEALHAVLSYGFAGLGLPVVAGVNDVPNEASDRMLRRLGFVFVRECDGPHYRSRVYRLERARWDSDHAG
jgi:ribosomal-protein-alanine N-acetyltransferase